MMTSSRNGLVAALLTVAVFVALLIRLHDAPIHLPHQGVHSVLAAESLARGQGLELDSTQPYAKFGPAYPVVLAALSWVGLNVNGAVHLVNCAALAAALLGLFRLCRRIVPSSAWVVMALYAIWAPNYYLLRGARPDLLVACLSIFALIATLRYLERGSTASLVATTLLCSVAALSRYMTAVTLVPVVFAALVWASRHDLRRRIGHLVLFALGTALPFVAWLARNYRRTGFLSGMSRTTERAGESGGGLLDNLGDLLRTAYVDGFVGDAMAIRQVLYGSDLPVFNLAAAVGLICVAALGFAVWDNRDEVRRELGAASSGGATFVLLAAYVSWYLVAMLLIWTFANNDPINTRYLAPIYPHAMALVALLLGTALGRARTHWPRLVVATLVGVLVLQSAGRVVRLLGDDPPGPRLINVVPIRSGNWVPALSWDGLEPIRRDRAKATGSNAGRDARPSGPMLE